MELDKPSLKNWRSHPFSAWAFRHVREIIPTAEVKNDPAKIWDLKFVKPPLQCETLAKVQNEIGLDALVIASGNSIVYEYYGNGAEADDQHILFSVSKSLLGLISDCLISDKIIRKDDKITDHLHELRGTAYDEATISQALDMRIDVDFDEDYTATEGPIIDYRYAANWNPTPEKMQNFNLKQFFKSLKTKMGCMVVIFITSHLIQMFLHGFLREPLVEDIMSYFHIIYGSRWDVNVLLILLLTVVGE